ncbi:MAG: phosphate signaling complex protein PhoU [Eubacteriales bacterium]|nr:phosphate signaling complex protein PhoU [Eubacteriales bacterium]
MVRIEFEKELSTLHQEIIRMGAHVEQAINDAIQALADLDTERALKVIANDDIIDELEREIDRRCVEIIARQQPVARDLRDLTSTLKLITDLERIADHASDISERIVAINQLPNKAVVPHDIITIAEVSKQMLRGALDAYVTRNEALASDIVRMDDRVDELYEKLKKYLIHLMSVDTENVEQLVEMLMISKYFERISDHAQNVAEWVLFFIKGRHVVHPAQEHHD